MSKVAIEGNALGSGTLTIAAPNTSTNRTLTLPDNTGTIITTGSTFAGTGPAFSAYMTNGSANLSLPNNTYTKVKFDTEIFDTNSCYDPTTNYRFTPNVAGYYLITAKVYISYVSSAPGRIRVAIYKNGSLDKYSSLTATAPLYENANITSLMYLNGSTDYIEIYALQSSSTDAFVPFGSNITEFSGFLARAA
jgi:hypothetical protein